VAMSVRVKGGYDPDYYFRQMRAKEAATGRPRGPDYYLSAAEQGGEPEGHWVGEGLAELGIHAGDVVDRDTFMSLYGEFTNPRTGEHLGKPPRDPAEVQRRFAEKKAGRPGLTRDEERQLWAEARAEASAPVMYWDSVFSADKTVSLAHATALAEAAAARRAGELEDAAAWQARADAIEEEFSAAVGTAIGWVQRELAFVRRGSHARRVEGGESGRFEDAQQAPAATFLQHTSRDGDPQMHMHVTWLNRLQATDDGAWLGLDSRTLHRIRGAASAIAALAMESRLASRVGLDDWAYRPASKGRVLASVPDAVIRAFSSRRREIDHVTAGLVAQYRAERGHDPTRRALTSMRQHAAQLTRKGKPEGALDYAQALRDWERVSRTTELGTLRTLARQIWHRNGDAAAAEPLTAEQGRVAMAAALATLAGEQATFTRADMLRAIAMQLPDHARAADSVATLEALADRALTGEAGEEVVCLTPAWPPVPQGLTRASDGGSIYRPHGAEQYATASQLSQEERLLRQAQAQGAPKLEREQAARLLGADAQALEAYIAAGCPASRERTATGLRMDQAVAAYRALVSGDRMDIMVGPAGAGKTHVLAAVAGAWRAAGMGRVIGLTMTSAARENLRDASPHIEGYNLAQFLGHDPDLGREARGTVAIGPGAMILLDEATTASREDLEAVTRAAGRQGAKVLGTGDDGQQQAVEAGGAFAMLVRRMAHSQLTEAQRLIHPAEMDAEWEADASLALRAGGRGAEGALRAYDDHGRLRGGGYEQMAEAAAQHYLAELLAGKDVILTAQQNTECRDLGRRVQEQLRKWGKINPARAAGLQEGERAHTGDRIIARENTAIPAGPDAGPVLNGDVLLVEEIPSDGGPVTLRRFNRDEDGRPTGLGEQFTLDRGYLEAHTHLAYARTWYTVQARTVDVGITLAAESRDLNGFYPSFTRGRQANYAYAYPERQEPGENDPPQGDPEAERHRRLQAGASEGAQLVGADEVDPLAILGKVVRRNAPELSASETRDRAESAADHLGVLHPIWLDQVRQEAGRRFVAMAQEVLPAHLAEAVLAGDTDDLWRAMRAAELANLDGPEVLREALAQGPLTGARSVPAVLTARIRARTEHLPPARPDTWQDRAPVTGDAGQDEWFRDVIATGMDDRQRRLGGHYATTAPVWATQALGDAPAEGTDERGEWERAAGKIAAYREIAGWDHPGEAIGPQPSTANPEYRAAWAEALAVMPKMDGIDLRGHTDGQLQIRRTAYERETAWAPKYVAEELRMARKAGLAARVEAFRRGLDAETAREAGDAAAGERHSEAAGQYEAMGRLAAREEEHLTPAHDVWRQWDVMTEPTRRAGKAAALEQQRRNEGKPAEPLKSAEPDPITKHSEAEDQAGRDETTLQALALTPDTDGAVPEAIEDARSFNEGKQDEINERASEKVPDEDPDYEPIGDAWQTLVERERDAVVQPPEPVVPPSEQVADREKQPEAGG
jgi:conjugative relaxase-like TrwC/TraI family protein